MTYDNSYRGVLFKNDRKESDKHPDYKGTINTGGQDYDLAAWITKSKKGQIYMSLKVSEQRERGENSDPQTHEAELDDEIPF